MFLSTSDRGKEKTQNEARKKSTSFILLIFFFEFPTTRYQYEL